MRSFHHLAVALALLGACSSRSDPPPPSSTAPAPAPTHKKDPAEARKLIAAGAVVIDVRSGEEYAAGHLPNAANIPVDELSRRLDEVAKLASDRAQPVVVYCGTGHRAAKAEEVLEAAGYSRVVNGGGFDDLR